MGKVLIESSSNLFHEMIDFHQLSDPHVTLFRFMLEVSRILFGTFQAQCKELLSELATNIQMISDVQDK